MKVVKTLDRRLSTREDTYIISCEKDRDVWSPLAKDGYPIYNQELILAGVLKQKLEWDSEKNRIAWLVTFSPIYIRFHCIIDVTLLQHRRNCTILSL